LVRLDLNKLVQTAGGWKAACSVRVSACLLEMEDSSIARRSLSLHRFLSGQPDCGLLHRGSREALLDAFLLLHNEMRSDMSRKTVKEASSFTHKCKVTKKSQVLHIRDIDTHSHYELSLVLSRY
jgi:hypothetical protein